MHRVKESGDGTKVKRYCGNEDAPSECLMNMQLQMHSDLSPNFPSNINVPVV